jgi:FkbM family methyltransferase
MLLIYYRTHTMKNLKETTATRYHKKFTYYTNDNIIGRSLREYGEYGQIEINFLLDIIGNLENNPLVIYDVGANIGVYATAFGSTGAEVHCFEPNPLNFALLKQNTAHLSNVRLHKAAATNVAGDILIQTFDPSVAGNYGELLINKDVGVSAKAIRLDDLNNLPAPHLIKIDAEGSELGVIQGCLEKIKANLPLVYYEAQESPHLDKIYNILTELGYHLYWGCVRNYNPANLKNNEENIFGISALFSVVAVPPSWNKVTNLDPVTGADDHWKRFVTE